MEYEYTIYDFWADWCQPCKSMAPIINAIETELDGKVHFAKIDAEAYPDLAEEFGVRNLPTLVLHKDGQEVGRIVGAMPKIRLKKQIVETYSL